MAVYAGDQGPINTAYVGYREIDLQNDTYLFWPSSFQDTPNVTAAYMRVATVADPDLILSLPDATQVSVGQNFIITNTSENPFQLVDFDGGALGTIDEGVAYYFILQANTTQAGEWWRLTFGAGTADIDAVDLAGRGLRAVGGKLDTSIDVIEENGPAYSVVADDNASLIVWTGGAGTLTLPEVADVPNGFYISFNNEGSGEVDIVTTDGTLIDKDASFSVGLSQSLSIIKSESNWWTLGYGQQTFFAINVLNKSVAGNSNITLSSSEAARTIQQYTGVLTGNIKVFFPISANEWTIFNNTTGPFTLSVQLAGPTGQDYVVPQGNTQIFYSDSTTMRITPSILSPNGILFPNGTVGAPGVAFSSDPSSGMYLPTAGTIGLSGGGVLGVSVSATAVTITHPTSIPSLTLSSPLPISSGGTGATTRAAAITALMPIAAAGDMVYFNGTTWVVIPAGAPSSVLTMVGGVPTWV